jgi:hypothetical protein
MLKDQQEFLKKYLVCLKGRKKNVANGHHHSSNRQIWWKEGNTFFKLIYATAK